mmetsp:Transcript_4571/g.13739  ORF Transcript_4571/g.13739 Transcript_4571/m.13739 type:complete len:470 (-) Transcript_4571:7330-8739(-)
MSSRNATARSLSLVRTVKRTSFASEAKIVNVFSSTPKTSTTAWTSCSLESLFSPDWTLNARVTRNLGGSCVQLKAFVWVFSSWHQLSSWYIMNSPMFSTTKLASNDAQFTTLPCLSLTICKSRAKKKKKASTISCSLLWMADVLEKLWPSHPWVSQTSITTLSVTSSHFRTKSWKYGAFGFRACPLASMACPSASTQSRILSASRARVSFCWASRSCLSTSSFVLHSMSARLRLAVAAGMSMAPVMYAQAASYVPNCDSRNFRNGANCSIVLSFQVSVTWVGYIATRQSLSPGSTEWTPLTNVNTERISLRKSRTKSTATESKEGSSSSIPKLALAFDSSFSAAFRTAGLLASLAGFLFMHLVNSSFAHLPTPSSTFQMCHSSEIMSGVRALWSATHRKHSAPCWPLKPYGGGSPFRYDTTHLDWPSQKRYTSFFITVVFSSSPVEGTGTTRVRKVTSAVSSSFLSPPT